MASKNISMAVIRRLPKYYRYLGDLLSKDIQRISSKELSDIIGFTASQIRQDLNNFGGFGQQGYGYNIEDLHNEIGKILGLNKSYSAVLVGAGNLGQAIANYSGFKNAGFEIKALFDANPKVIGLKIRDFEILDSDLIEEYVKEIDQYWIQKHNPCQAIEPQIQMLTNKPSCPNCGSTNIKKITASSRIVSGLVLGILSSNIGKTYQCNNCGYKW